MVLERCAHAGCGGSIEDGYCDACGLAPVATPAATPPVATWPVAPAATASLSERSTSRPRGTARSPGRSPGRAPGARPLVRPPLPPHHPLAAVLAAPLLQRKRHCSACDQPLRRDAGFCPKCGQEYSFRPTLAAGDVVAGKYEIKGTLAFGGLGWIYLALDTVLGRWVVLKGLLDSKDPQMVEVAVQERESLAAVKHPNIVGIYDFVLSDVPAGVGGAEVADGTDGSGEAVRAGFIVLEYVNGKTLMALRKEAGGPLPPLEACAYIWEILPALGHLADRGLVYCDVKPENVMVEEDTVKLIDLGAVRALEATGGEVYGSKGYTAPEAHDAPTPRSDLYSVGRALAVLVASFDFQGRYEDALPPTDEVPLFAAEDALYRFLAKATRSDPATRFASAEEMADQLLGVMRGLARTEEARARLGRVESTLFEEDDEQRGDDVPRPKVRVDPVHAAFDLELRLVDDLVTKGRVAEAELRLAEAARARPDDWRVAWSRGRCLFLHERTDEALAVFTPMVAELPGELAPRQVVAALEEQAGHLVQAAAAFEAVLGADPSRAAVALALGRCRERLLDRKGAITAYRGVPPMSLRYAEAQLALATLLLSNTGGTPTRLELVQAAQACAALDGKMAGLARHELRASVFLAAAQVPRARREAAPCDPAEATILGVPWEPRAVRRAAAHELRTCARFVEGDERTRFVDRANAARPLTWF